MSILLISCPHCGSELKLKDRRLLGRKGKCPRCQQSFLMTEPEPVELELSEPPEAIDALPSVDPFPAPVAPTPPKVTFAPGPENPFDLSAESPEDDASFAPPFSLPHAAPSTGSPFGAGPTGVSAPMGVSPLTEVASVSTPAPAAPLSTPLLRTRKGGRRAERSPWLVIGGVTVALIAVVAGGIFFYQQNEAERLARRKAGPKVITRVIGGAAATDPQAATVERILESIPGKREPISLELVPDGTNLIVHLRPSELWAQNDQADELRAALGPLSGYLEQQFKTLTSFSPQDIREALFCFLPNERGTAPDLVTVVRLAKPQRKSDLIELFGGRTMETNGSTVYLSDTRAVLIRDLDTIAIAPVKLAESLGLAATGKGVAFPSLEPLLSLTDRRRQVSVLFVPDQIQLEPEVLVARPLIRLIEQVSVWFGEESDAVCWSWQILPQEVLSDVLVRARSGVTDVAAFESRFRERINAFPEELLGVIRQMQPPTVGRRRVIGRVPAMAQAMAMATAARRGPRHVELLTQLPERALPNIALGALLAWDESTRTNFARPSGPTRAPTEPPPTSAGTLADRLKTKVDIDFRRTPLQEAVDYLAGEAKFSVEIDGDALKLSGFTKNMTQDIQTTGQPVEKTFQTIVEKYPKMCIVLDEARNTVIVTTTPVAESQGKVPYVFPK